MSGGILVINQNWLGDVLFSTPALRALRKSFPSKRIACVVPPRAAAALRNNPYLNEVMIAPDRTNLSTLLPAIMSMSRIRRERFDSAILFHRSGTKAFLARVCEISERFGYEWPGRGASLTRSVPLPPTMHKIDFFLHLVEAYGAHADGRYLDFFPDESAARSDLAGLGLGLDYAAIHPGGNWDLKRWPADHFIQFIRLCLTHHSTQIVLCGTPSEVRLVESIHRAVNDRRVISACGRTSLSGLAVLLRGARFLLSNDSGPIHLAASQKTPILGLYGPTRPDLTGPVSEGPVQILRKDVGCQTPCYFRRCSGRFCMEWITPEEAFMRAQPFLGKGSHFL